MRKQKKTKADKPIVKTTSVVLSEAERFVLDALIRAGKPLLPEELEALLGVAGKKDLEQLQRQLRHLQKQGRLMMNRSGRFVLPEKADMLTGCVIGHADGFGFVKLEAGGDDLLLPAREMRRVLHDDKVLVKRIGTDRRGRGVATVVERVAEDHGVAVIRKIVGRLYHSHHSQYVAPEDPRYSRDIEVLEDITSGAEEGQVVVIEVTRHPLEHRRIGGCIVEILGRHMAPGMEIEVAIRKHDLPHRWPEPVLAEASRVPQQVRRRDLGKRRDLRQRAFVTIDGADARDFDDAVCCESRGKGWTLWVAIADVAAYVRPGSALDDQAQERGNSIYFPNRVIPMLPEALSNGICSLNPEQDRLCMCCEMQIGPRGAIKSSQFYAAVLRSKARLTYTQVASALEHNDLQMLGKANGLLPDLQRLECLFQALLKARQRRGAVDLDLPETRIFYNDERKIERIEASVRNDAHRIIEECMLAANVCAAHFVASHKACGMYRVHPAPERERLTDLRAFLGQFGYQLGGGDQPQGQDYQRVIDQLPAEPARRRLVQTMLLRSMSRAVYSEINNGHFALMYEGYAHFTSPIRRYPDLVLHRVIKQILAQQSVPVDPPQLQAMHELAVHCSTTERRAEEASREVIQWLKVEFMQDRIGEQFDATITTVTSFGVFVELKTLFVEGLVHITELGNDYFHFDPLAHCLSGEHGGQRFTVGDTVRVRLVRAGLEDAKIDFSLVSGKSSKGRKRQKRRAKK